MLLKEIRRSALLADDRSGRKLIDLRVDQPTELAERL